MEKPSVDTIIFEQKRFTYGLRQQARVISALVVRETATRFGRYSFGLFWAFLEPAVYILLYLLLHSMIVESIPFGDSSLIFFVSGIIVFRFYTSIASHTMSAITANNALLCYPLVRPLDTIIARIILEWVIMLVVSFTALAMVSLFLGYDIIVDKGELLLGILATMCLGSCVGALNAVMSALYPTWAVIHSLIGFPLFFTSGLFYVPAALPPVVRDIIAWNPILHCVEWVRGSFYLDYYTLLDRSYIFGFATFMFALALTLERAYRNKLVRQ